MSAGRSCAAWPGSRPWLSRVDADEIGRIFLAEPTQRLTGLGEAPGPTLTWAPASDATEAPAGRPGRGAGPLAVLEAPREDFVDSLSR